MNFIVRSLIKKQLKGLPDDQVDMLIEALEKNPEFFQKIAEEVKAKIARGISQQDAAVEAMNEHADELKKILGK